MRDVGLVMITIPPFKLLSNKDFFAINWPSLQMRLHVQVHAARVLHGPDGLKGVTGTSFNTGLPSRPCLVT